MHYTVIFDLIKCFEQVQDINGYKRKIALVRDTSYVAKHPLPSAYERTGHVLFALQYVSTRSVANQHPMIQFDMFAIHRNKRVLGYTNSAKHSL